MKVAQPTTSGPTTGSGIDRLPTGQREALVALVRALARAAAAEAFRAAARTEAGLGAADAAAVVDDDRLFAPPSPAKARL